MDVGSNRKSRMLYQRGDKVTEGVVDLRCFARPRYYKADSTERVFQEVRAARKPLDLRCYAQPRVYEPLKTEEAYQEKKVYEKQKSLNDFARSNRYKTLGIEEAFEKENEAVESRQPLFDFSGLREKLQNRFGKIQNQAGLALSEKEETPVFEEEERKLEKRTSFRLPELSFPKIKPSISLPSFSLPEIPVLQFLRPSTYHMRTFARFAVASIMVPVTIFSFSFAQGQFEEKGKVLGANTAAYNDLKSAAASAYASDFSETDQNFNDANANFAKARETLNNLGLGIGDVIGNLPIDTPISTAQNLNGVGQNISLAGKEINAMLGSVSDQMESDGDNNLSLTALGGLENNLQRASMFLGNANEQIQKVDIKYIPSSMQDKIDLAKTSLPAITRNFSRLSEDYPLIMKMLGSERQQKYLLLFENSSEMRATGGFIGSYGIMDIQNGQMKDLTIDGIFNPDGQLQEKIVPPMPIQKISANWSMHDSNWFADFPTSAQKAALFYEKTGGATVDGVIAITPEVIQSLLEITGPIDMPEYGLTLTKDNFLSETQNQVENLYDKKENKPKKILSDLAPIMMDRLFKDSSLDKEAKIQRTLSVIEKIESSLQEKDILIYHRDNDIETMIQKRGWGGEIIQNQQGDYLDVINSNINGYKTDAVIDESINLETEIQDDGSVIDTLTITRKHNGGNEQYDWYNRVNADYMRVYVPKGSVLLSASGNTVEDYIPPVDYSDFKTDPDVQAIESTIKIDPDSKTKIFEETGKTVFGNWVYVSPQESVTVVYKYELPFKINFGAFTKTADAYSAVVQKQAGSMGSNFTASLKVPEKWKMAWSTDNFDNTTISEKLTKDLVYAEIFTLNK